MELNSSGFPLFFMRSCVSKRDQMDADTALFEGITDFVFQGIFLLLLQIGKLRHRVVS